MRAFWLPIFALLSLAIACSGGDDAEPTPTVTLVPATSTEVPEASPTLAATPTPTPRPTVTPEPEAVTFTTWSVDVESGSVTEVAQEQGRCIEVDGGAEVNGGFYAEVACGPISPDGRWMTYQVIVGNAQGSNVPIWDQWAVNLETGETRVLQEGLLHCGGCDGRFGASWSPTGRYVYFSEWVQNGHTFLSDLSAGTTRALFDGSTEITAQPRWSPAEDALLYRRADGSVVFENLVAGTMLTLQGATWPLRFDATGSLGLTYLVSLRDAEPGGETSLIDLESGATTATLSGQATYPFFGAENVYKVAKTDDGFVAAINAPDACEGTGIYQGPDDVTCLEGALASTVSSDGTRVAFARATDTARVFFNDQPMNMMVYEIGVFDVASGEESILAPDALSTDVPPLIEWMEGSTTLRVRWPIFPGP